MSDTTEPKPWWKEYRPLIAWVIVSLTMAIAGAIGGWEAKPLPPPVEVEKPVPVLVPPLDEFGAKVSRDGWTPDAEASDADARTTQFKTFASTPAGQVQELPKQVFLWNAEQKLTGKPPPLKDQNPEGSCVGFGTTTAIERTLAAEIAARRGDPAEFAHFSEEVTYVGSRVQGAKLVGGTTPRGEGSAGVYAKAFVTGYGMVPKANYPGVADLSKYSAQRAAQWRYSGMPAALEPTAKKFPVKSAAKVTSWQQFKAAVGNGYGVSICAQWSYSRARDANGVALPTREGWNHCMAGDGYIVLEDGREFGHIENSWSAIPGVGPYHTGPTGWGNPTTGGFWASSESIDRALRQGESYAYSGVTGFPARQLPDWFVRAEPARRPRQFDPRDLFALAP